MADVLSGTVDERTPDALVAVIERDGTSGMRKVLKWIIKENKERRAL